jgi:hypothetical protein
MLSRSSSPVECALPRDADSSYFCVTPQALEAVERSRVLLKDVENHIHIVQENPIRAAGFPMPGDDPFLCHPFVRGVCDGANLNIGIRRANNEEISHGRQITEIHDHDITGLLGERQLRNGKRKG